MGFSLLSMTASCCLYIIQNPLSYNEDMHKHTYAKLQSGVQQVLFALAYLSSLHSGCVLSRQDNIKPGGASLILV